MEPSLAPAHRPAQEASSCAYALADYPEFRAPGGNRYLKKLLRQILPMALYRTWEIFTDHQARGNDCYLSVVQLAVLAGRSLRTIQKNIASFQAKHLLVERVERKSIRNAEGRMVSRFVVVKDFAALYALAHEYHEWLQSEEMIPPERLCVSLLLHDDALMVKLRRFENYRRLLLHAGVIPSPSKENDRLADDAQVGEQCESLFLPMTNTASKEVSKEVSFLTPKRISESSQRDDSLGEDSFDSVSSFSEPSEKRGNAGAHMAPAQPTRANGARAEEQSQNGPSESRTTPDHAAIAQPSLVSHPAPLGNPRKAPNHTRPTAQGARAQTKQCRLPQQRRGQAPEGSVTCAQLPDHPLVRSFLHEIAIPFGDRHPQGTRTRILGLLASASLEETEVLPCLIRAYTIARDTRTIRACYVNPETGQANRMPLFCTLVERFVQTRLRQDPWRYSWHQMEEAITVDERLRAWWTKHQVLLVREQPSGSEHDLVPLPTIFQDKQESMPPPLVGWARREAAQAWGERLLDVLMASGYEAEVRLRQVGQWYQLVLIGEDCSLAIETPAQAQVVLEQFQKGDV